MEKYPREKERIIEGILSYFNDREITRFIQSDGKTDLFRALIVSDQKLKDDLSSIKIEETTVYHLKERQPTIPIFNEILDRGFESKGSIKINRNLLDTGKLISGFFDLSRENLINAVNSFSAAIIKYELKAFERQKDPNLGGIIKFYEDLRDELTRISHEKCIMRLGQGSSALGITLFLNFSDNKEMVRKFKKLEIINFNQADRRNPRNIISRQGRILVFVDRNSRNRPRINETWLCSVKSTRGNSKYVSLIERVTPSFDIESRGDMLYPLTRKFAVSTANKFLPFGWIKMSWK